MDAATPSFDGTNKERIGYDYYGDSSQATSEDPDNNPTIDYNNNGHKDHGVTVEGVLDGVGINPNVIGTASNTKLIPFKVSWTWGSHTQVYVSMGAVVDSIDKIESMVDEGYDIRVVTGAWAFGPDGTVDGGKSGDLAAVKAAVEGAAADNILFISAAQNDGKNLNNETGSNRVYPAMWQEPNVITVGATADTGDNLAQDTLSGADGGLGYNPDFYSNFGTNFVNIAAPGYEIETTIHRSSESDTDAYASEFGTSLAMPQVAGTAALIVSLDPDISVSQLRNAILNYATQNAGNLSSSIQNGRFLNSYASVKSVADGNGFAASVLGDNGGNPTNDTITMQVKSGDSSHAQIYVNGSLYATVANTVATKVGIFGLGGNDTITINSGVLTSAYISGGDGNDTIAASGSGNDTIFGGSGDDRITGGNGNDNIDGGDGNDTIHGGLGTNTLTGGDGSDHLISDSGSTKNIFYTKDSTEDYISYFYGTDSIGSSDSVDSLTKIT